MPRFLLISGAEQGQKLRALLPGEDPARLCEDARQAKEYLDSGAACDCCILNLPLADEDGGALALGLAQRTQAQILLLAPAERCARLREQCASSGVMVLQKPLGRQTLTLCLEMMRTVQTRLARLQEQNEQLTQKLNELSLIHRAKFVLISALGMTEPQAHRHMERQAMNQRVTKAEVALNVLKLYDNA